MDITSTLKSKKILIGLVVLILAGGGYFLYQTSKTEIVDEEISPERAKSASPATAKSPASAQSKESTQSPLFQAMQALKDPFREEDPKRAELAEKLEVTKKEVEYLKATLEERRLRKEISDIEKSLTEGESNGTSGSLPAVLPSDRQGIKAGPEEKVWIKAIMSTDEKRRALVVYNGKKAWVREGERFAGWMVKSITDDRVVLLRNGGTFVFPYDRSNLSWEEGP